MLNKDGMRELTYVVKVDNIEPIEGADRVELATVGGWKVVVGKGEFQAGDYGVYFEIDSKLPEEYCFAFLAKRKYKVKTQKFFKGTVISQGLLMPFEDFVDINGDRLPWINDLYKRYEKGEDIEHFFLTDIIGVVHIQDAMDNAEAASPSPTKDMKYKNMISRHPALFKKPLFKRLMKHKITRTLLYLVIGRRDEKKKISKAWPTGLFEGVSKTDQERCENMPWVLEDKTPFIKTQKCDGSSATYIMARLNNKQHFKYEFYVCSRNVRMFKPSQDCFYEDSVYWEMAEKYNIEGKMLDYLLRNPDVTFVCWQGEICGPSIQKNPQHLSERHLFMFHMTTSRDGRWDICKAKVVWDWYGLETVPIEDESFILPDDFEEFKLQADGYYDPSCCEGNTACPREGFVYYKTTDPTFSFKNVSRTYLLNH